ncbi:MAG: hypothetical protein K1000chlam2_00719 [Chlamydiae bacterium]|nr:hypothetical protein [Chlamydiota bacterium]
MRYRLLFLLLVALVTGWVVFHKPMQVVRFCPFDEAQIQEHYTPMDFVNFYQRLSKKKWRLLNRLYKTHLEGRRRAHKHHRIPKIIHQIYLEGSVPEPLRKIQATWKEKHPKWEYHLWTEEEIQILYLQNRPLYEMTKNAKQKSEILRYEILYQFGGVFVENTLECLKSLDIFNDNCDFYAGITDQIRSPRISSKLIGTIPNHRLMRKCIQELRANPPTFGSTLLTRCFFHTVKKSNPETNVALPASFFYPKLLNSIQENTYVLPH